MIVYRILSFIVNLFCAFAALVTIVALLFLLQDPTALLQVFLMAGVVLYGWFANRFYVYVLTRKQKMTKKQKAKFKKFRFLDALPRSKTCESYSIIASCLAKNIKNAETLFSTKCKLQKLFFKAIEKTF